MSDTTKNILSKSIQLIVFIICITLCVVGQKKDGFDGLKIMLIGLAGLIFLLWNYNRKYK